jgi:hypothetical protein
MNQRRIPTWKDSRCWALAGKAVVLFGPIAILYAVFGSRVLLALCAATGKSWCDVWFVLFVIGIVGMARVFYLLLRPKGV